MKEDAYTFSDSSNGLCRYFSGCTAGGTENMHNTPGAVTLVLVPEDMEESLND